MFQTFDAESDPTLGTPRVAQLREWLAGNNLDGFIVPRADEHQGEYVAARSERLKWLTGFSGSAGVAIVLRDRALIFVDGRYTLQVREQVDLDDVHDRKPDRQPAAGLDQGQSRQGRAPRLRPVAAHDRRGQGAEGSAEKSGAELVPLERQSDRRSVDGPAEAAAGAGRDPSDRALPANSPRTSWRGSRQRSPRKAPRMRC